MKFCVSRNDRQTDDAQRPTLAQLRQQTLLPHRHRQLLHLRQLRHSDQQSDPWIIPRRDQPTKSRKHNGAQWESVLPLMSLATRIEHQHRNERSQTVIYQKHQLANKKLL